MAQVLREVDKFFMQKSPVHQAAQAIATELHALGIPFAIAGALAANAHGHRRTTEDVDILLTREGLAEFKKAKLGLGWVEKFAGSKGLRDVRNKVNIDVLLTGDFPGDGKPKPIAFPHPGEVRELDPDGLPFINLKTLLELKIASGMTAPHRPRDLDDAIRLIQSNQLTQDYAQQLHPFVRRKFRKLWHFAQVSEDY